MALPPSAFSNALSGLSMGASVAQGLYGARAARQRYGAEAEADLYNARLAEAQGSERARAIRAGGEYELSRARATLGKSGVALEGSPLEALSDSYGAVERDAANAQLAGSATAALARRRAFYAQQTGRQVSTMELLSGVVPAIRQGAGLIPWRGAGYLGS
jgi:hypothetical protein